MVNKVPEGWETIGRDGELLLYASPDKDQGVLIDEATGKPRGEPQPLQVFFKWGVFEAMENES